MRLLLILYNLKYKSIPIQKYSSIQSSMSKTTFLQRSQKCVKFFDNAYHFHKATYKTLSSFYKQYSQLENTYSNDILKLSKTSKSNNSIVTENSQYKNQLQSICTIMKELVGSLQVVSQLKFNFSEKLKQISVYYYTEYSTSKKKKQQQMKLIKDKNQLEYEESKQKKDRNLLNKKQQDICKSYYNHLELYSEEEIQRNRKIKQQSIIYFSILKKVLEKQSESVQQFSQKLTRNQIQIKNLKADEIELLIVDQHNGYTMPEPYEKLHKKKQDLYQSLNFKRDSLRESMNLRQKSHKIEACKNKLEKTIQKYKELPQDLFLISEDNQVYGLFDCQLLKNRQLYSRQIKSETLKYISYQMLCRFWLDNSNTDIRINLQIIKTNLKITDCKPTVACKTLKDYLYTSQGKDQNLNWHLGFLLILDKIYKNNANQEELVKYLKHPEPLPSQIDSFCPLITTVILDILLQAFIINKYGQAILVDGYVEILPVIIDFSHHYLKMSQKDANLTVILLMLKKISRSLIILNIDTNEQIQQLLKIKEKEKQDLNRVSEYNKIHIRWMNSLLNQTTQLLLEFYKHKLSLTNIIKILIIIENTKILKDNKFSGVNHVNNCLRNSGFNYIYTVTQSRAILENDNQLDGEQRLKYIVDMLEELSYDKIYQKYFQDSAGELSTLLGVGRLALYTKFIQQFTIACLDIIEVNIQLAIQQVGVDRDGYVLKLGLFLSKFDQNCSKPIAYYDKYFKVLEGYLSSTQKEYDKMLEKSRQTQLWITQQNSQATQNCIDFCSLLSKPFQFLLSSLRELQKSEKQTDFQKKYTDYIKLKLNSSLKEQILKYLYFLNQSLDQYKTQQAILNLKPKFKEYISITQDNNKNKLQLFKQLTRRLFNLLFLKDQLQEIICDFLDHDIYQMLDFSIFNTDKLKKIISLNNQNYEIRDMLKNILEIIQGILDMETKIIITISKITVSKLFMDFFVNLYWQDEKGFFTFKDDYKLSKNTFVSMANWIEEWFKSINKNIPEDFFKQYVENFLKFFHLAIRRQMLNPLKFKLPLPRIDIIKYLENDLHFLVTLMKQKYFPESAVEEYLEIPLNQIIQQLNYPQTKLTSIFQQSTLKNNKEISLIILLILNLRYNDDKAEEFIKKYKNTIN